MATDYYSQCEAAVMAKLRTLSSIFPNSWQVSTDLEDLKRGGKYFAIFFPGQFSTARADGKDKFTIWAIGFDLYCRYSTHKESLGLFKAARAEIFALLHSDPMLDRSPGVYNVLLSATSEVMQDLSGDNPNFVVQTFNAAVSQRIRFDF